MIRIYHHIYPTNEGLQISKQQKERIENNIFDKFEYIPNVVKKYETEIWTLKKLQNDAAEFSDDDVILYIHTKGATKPTIERKEWREYMEVQLIDNYKFHLDILSKGFDSSGVLLGIPNWSITKSGDLFYGGNFWWTTSKYIKSLPDDLGWGNWIDNQNLDENSYGNKIRWAEIKFINQGINFKPYGFPFYKKDEYKNFIKLMKYEIEINKYEYNNIDKKHII